MSGSVANLPPFMNSVGLIPQILEKMAQAQKPARFTQDFLGTKLGFTSGSAKAFIPLLKRIGFLQADGTPTDLYSRYRNPSERGAAMAEGMKIGYTMVFERNEFAYDLGKDKLTNLIVEITGLAKDNPMVRAVVGTFSALRAVADFDQEAQAPASQSNQAGSSPLQRLMPEEPGERSRAYDGYRTQPEDSVGINLAYTINLNLPESTNPEVFNAIFKALRENLLKK